MKNKQAVKKGFTLIELLVVVLIIGILASIALPQYQKAVSKSKYVQAKTMTQAMATSARLFHLANGSWPLNFDDLTLDITKSATSIEGNATIARFSWGVCHLACSGQCGGCYIKMGNQYPALGYWKESFLSDSTACIALDSAPDAATQICQAETNKASGTHSSAYGWTSYSY